MVRCEKKRAGFMQSKKMSLVPEGHLRRVKFNISWGVDTISKYNFLEFSKVCYPHSALCTLL